MPRVDAIVKEWSHRKAVTLSNQEKHEIVNKGVEAILNGVEKDVSALANLVHWKPDIISAKILGTDSRLHHQTRDPTARNAAVHLVSEAFKAENRYFHFKDKDSQEEVARIQKELEGDEVRLLAALDDIRALCDAETHQVRIDRKAREVDTRATQDALKRETTAFNTRVDGHIFVLCVRGDAKDYARPAVYGTDLAFSFFEDAMKLKVEDMLLDFEAYCTTGAKGAATTVNGLVTEFKSKIRTLLRTALQDFTGSTAAKMSYKNFGRVVQDAHEVILVGWTYSSFTDPSNISSINELRKLHTAIKERKCFFRKMTDEELATRAREREAEELAAAREKVSRKRRTDEESEGEGAEELEPLPERRKRQLGGHEPEEQPKKKRGRPRKTTEVTEATEAAEAASAEPPSKKPRGRPKKTAEPKPRPEDPYKKAYNPKRRVRGNEDTAAPYPSGPPGFIPADSAEAVDPEGDGDEAHSATNGGFAVDPNL